MGKKTLNFTQKITITLEGEGYVDSFSTTKTPLTSEDAIDWFTYQVLPALGYNVRDGE